MTIEHNHKDATRSSEADRIEGEIESIEHNIVNLVSEFIRRVKSTFSLNRVLESHKILCVIIMVLVFWFVFSPPAKKIQKSKNCKK
jgi:type III secretory pathway component EscU